MNNCQVSRPLVDNTFQYDSRLDWNANSKNQAFARLSGSIEKEYHTPPLGSILDGGPFNDSGPSSFIGYNFAMSETHIFNPTLTNEARLGFNYGHFTLTPAGNTQNYAAQLGLGGIPFGSNQGGLPIAGAVGQGSGTMNLFGSTSSTSFGTPSYTYTTEHQDISQILDNVTKVAGKHTLKFGVSIESIRFITLQPKNPVGGYNFTGVHTGGANGTVGSGLADFLTDQVNEAFISAIATSDQLRWDSAAFAQDDWTPTRKLTLNLGLRWEDPTSYRDLHGKQSNFVPTSTLGQNTGTANLLIPITESTNPGVGSRFQAIAGPNVTVVYTDNQYLVNNAWKNFGPRLGAAYRVNERSVVRAGYGFFYAGLESQGYGPNIGANFPFQTTNDYVSTGCSGPGAKCPVALSNLGNPITLETGFTDVLATGFVNSVTAPVTNAINPRTQVPYTEDFNLTAEYGVTNNMSAKVAYVGSQSHHTTTSRNINNAYALQKAGTNINAARPFPGLGSVGTLNYFGQSSYNSLQVSVDHRPAHGLSFSANYTLAHTVGLGGGGVDGGGVGIIDSPLFNYRNSLADAAIDVRHRVSVNGSYALPFGENRRFLNHRGALNLFVGGWNTSATFSAQTGIPFTVGLTSFSGFSTAAGASGAAIMVADPFKAGGTPPANHPAASCPTQVRTRTNWYNPCAFSNAPQSGTTIAAGTFVSGAAALPFFGGHNNQIHGPGQQRANMSLFKNFVYRETNSLQIRADVFNLFNTPSNSNPSNTGLTAAGGQISVPRSFQKDTPDSRFIQVAMKISF